ncbi:MAG TPA: CHAD domain-containing protein [Gemmatimonadaceae bacterium]|jgi:CHAD domain-containing protein|nr:CHAD domain-containing protein [Gemmatimonadaceae bacterium]
MHNEPDPLALSAARGARLIALDRLDQAGDQADRLANNPHSLDALHDLRVALRRVRSWIRAFRLDLNDSVSRKDRHRLRDIVDATNRGRDADVQVEWLRRASSRGDEPLKRGAKRLIDLIRDERDRGGAPLNGSSLDKFEEERSRLTKRLSTVSEPVRRPKAPPPTLAAAIGARLPAHFEILRKALELVHTADDDRQAHAARIAAKRLRYLLEPAEDVRGSKSIIKQLKRLQDDLGELHDAHLLGQRVKDAVLNDPGTETLALEAVARALAADRAEAFGRIDRRWLSDAAAIEKLGHGVESVAHRLAAMPREV